MRLMGFCRNKRKRQSSACLISAKIQSTAPCARSSNGFTIPLEAMLTCVRWFVAYPLSLRHVEEMMRKRGVFVVHATVHRWAIKMVPVLAADSWRVPSTCTTCQTRSPLTKAAPIQPPLKASRLTSCVDILMRQNKYLNNIVEQGPPGHQTAYSSNAGFQVILECQHYHYRHRNHVNVRSAAVLQPRCLISSSATQLFSAKLHYCDRSQATTLEQLIEVVESYIRWHNEKRIKISHSSLSTLEYRASLGFTA